MGFKGAGRMCLKRLGSRKHGVKKVKKELGA